MWVLLSTATTAGAWGASQILRASTGRSPVPLGLGDSADDVSLSQAEWEREHLSQSLVS